MDKQIVHWRVDVESKYSPMVICTQKGWRFDAGIKIMICDVEFYANPSLEEVIPGLYVWRITDGMTGARVFESEPVPEEEVDAYLEDLVFQFSVHLATRSNGDINVIKSKCQKVLAEYEERFGKKPETFPEEFLKKVEQMNAITLQTGQIVH